jgi:hypothetical protein
MKIFRENYTTGPAIIVRIIISQNLIVKVEIKPNPHLGMECFYEFDIGSYITFDLVQLWIKEYLAKNK